MKLVEIVAPRAKTTVRLTPREALEKGEGLVEIYEGIKVFENPLLGGVARPRTMVTGIDVADYEAVNKAHILSQKMLFEYTAFLRNHVPGFEKAQISRLADATFNRAGRSLESDFKPTQTQAESDFKADDAITMLQRGEDKGVFEVPYRTVLAKKTKNLMAVGKSSSGGALHRLHSLSIIQGQATGTAAALRVRTHKKPGELNIKLLQAELKKQWIILPDK